MLISFISLPTLVNILSFMSIELIVLFEEDRKSGVYLC